MKSKMKEKAKLSALYSLVIGPFIIGGNLFLYFMDRIPWYDLESPGVFDYVYINLAMIGGILLPSFFMKRRNKRKGNVPIADERTLQVMKNYLLWVLSLIFFVSAIILLVLFFIGIETIEIGWIFVYLSAWITFSLLGALIASRR